MMNKTSKFKLTSLITATILCVSSLLPCMTANATDANATDANVTDTNTTEVNVTDTNTTANSTTELPESRPTASCTWSGSQYYGVYTVPVYIYSFNSKTGEDPSMANDAIVHQAEIDYHKDENGNKIYTVTLTFNPIVRQDLRGHIQKFYYYNLTSSEYSANIGTGANDEKKVEVTREGNEENYKTEIDFDDNNFGYSIEYISKVTFDLPSKESDVICCFRVDAMGDTEQNAVLVFDYSNATPKIKDYLQNYVVEAKKTLDEGKGKYTEASLTNLESAINKAERVLSGSTEAGPIGKPSIYDKLILNIDLAEKCLVELEILENGVYTIPVVFYDTEKKTKELSNLYHNSYPIYESTGEKNALLTTVLKSTATLTAENGVYTIEIPFNKDDANYYFAYLSIPSSGTNAVYMNVANSTKPSRANSERVYQKVTLVSGDTVGVVCGEGTCLKILNINSKYSINELIYSIVYYSKNDGKMYETQSTGEYITPEFDWNNVTWVSELPTDKSSLESRIKVIKSTLEKVNLTPYTDSSIANLKSVLADAENVYNSEKSTQAEINAAVDSLIIAAALEQKVSLAGYTAEMADYVGLNYYLNISEELKAQSPYVKFTFGNAESQIVKLDEEEYVNGQGYKFTAKLDPKNMTDTVTAEVYVGDEKVPTTTATTKKLSTTIKAYADTIIANENNGYTESAISTAKALLNYGGYSQVLFDYNTDSLANASIDSDVSSVTAETLEKYIPTKSGSDATAKFTGYNLYLDSLTSMRFYYTGDVTVSSTAVNATTGKSGSNNYIEITNITPANLLNGYDVKIGEMTIHASPASYAHTVLTKSSDEKLQNAMKAMILYSQAATEYAASIKS